MNSDNKMLNIDKKNDKKKKSFYWNKKTKNKKRVFLQH